MMPETLELEIELNRICQGHVDVGGAIVWFETFSEANQRDVLREFIYMVLQARATSDDVVAAIQNAGLKPTLNPCVMLSRGVLKIQLAKAAQLPKLELSTLFKLLIELFRIADSRRRLQCGDHCKHWWHRNLGDHSVIEDIRRRYYEGML